MSKLEKLEALFSKIRIALGEEVKMEEAKMGELILRSPSFAVGESVKIVNADGTETAAPDGEHTLDDGRVIVTLDGVIAEVKEKTQDVEVSLSAEKLNQIKEAFASGTPEQRITNLEILSKALMEYAFGWELREASQRTLREQAINVFKEQFSKILDDKKTIEQNFSSVKSEKQTLIDALNELKKEVEALKAEESAKPIHRRPEGDKNENDQPLNVKLKSAKTIKERQNLILNS